MASGRSRHVGGLIDWRKGQGIHWDSREDVVCEMREAVFGPRLGTVEIVEQVAARVEWDAVVPAAMIAGRLVGRVLGRRSGHVPWVWRIADRGVQDIFG